ncbi:hypothetical protein P170DRAFT_344444 [Aspergillus steynii IBT 23096]|uniref:Ipa protein n=1 Tax=Aspergillus steynii IBT 23096 TaxID=1392250 RepID=A0A2I2GMM5_9EURO|nr:uncharacterized protein P170DRAFT_344444 [Aspergillus steynii IBT 23096]PLB54148.1 hypothetical protein P170DRAFT_344444 [Aspergillus steynii IBT 23096]
MWHLLDQEGRVEVLQGHKAGGLVLDDPEDFGKGEICLLIPEWNLQDLAKPDSDLLLDLIKHRATNWLSDQYLFGPNGSFGDEQFMLSTIHHCEMELEEFEDGKYRCFASEYHYGEEVSLPEHQCSGSNDKELPRCTQPSVIGNYILARQMQFLQMMNLVVWEILAVYWRGNEKGTSGGKPQGPGTMKLIGLCIREQKDVVSLESLAEMAADNKRSLENWAWLCRTDPEYLINMIYAWFFTQPGLIGDSDNLLLPTMVDKHVSTSLFEMLHTFVHSAAVWDFIARLLRELATTKEDDRFYRAAILQELVNVIHFEYERSQTLLKRYTQRSVGCEHLKRIDGPNNSTRIILKTEPAAFTRASPFIHYILRLYQAKTKVADAGHWLQKIFGLYNNDDALVDLKNQGPRDAIHELAVITGLFKSLKKAVQLPPSNPRKGRTYINCIKAMAPEIESIKESLDVTDLAMPPDRIRIPGVLERVLDKVDEVIDCYTGTQLSTLYEERIEECMLAIRKRSDENRTQVQRERELMAERLSMTEAPAGSLKIKERKVKPKTRPTQSSSEQSDESSSSASSPPEIVEERPTMKVKPESYDVFKTLLSRAEPRGSLAWSAFTAAMSELGFAVTHKYGSVVTFEPSASLSHLKAFTFHRPHESRLEGHRLLWLSRRLKRVYEWDIDCFESE